VTVKVISSEKVEGFRNMNLNSNTVAEHVNDIANDVRDQLK
jgi:hypothetical protein